jgi:putative endonuclease
MDHEYWTYIVASLNGTLYIGTTNNIERRMWEHKSREFEGFASKYHCDRLMYFEGFDDVRNAIDREKQLRGAPVEEDCFDPGAQSAVARLGGEVGMEDGVCRGIDQGAVSSGKNSPMAAGLAWGPSTAFGWRLASLRMTEFLVGTVS